MKDKGIEFLNKIYRQMHLEDSVVYHSNISDEPYKKIEKYLNCLENVHKKALINGKKSLLLNFYYKKYVIDFLPESYIDLLKKIDRERGLGNKEYSMDERNKIFEEIVLGQKRSLKAWVDYLDDDIYPIWFKNYVFQGMVRLTEYDKDKKCFGRRSKNSVSPFINLDKDALDKVYNILCSFINGCLSDLQEEIIKNGLSFKKLYSFFINENFLKSFSDDIDGIWIKYNQGDDYKPLFNSIIGKNTGWCTCSEERCIRQLEVGDFYVYYTKDLNGDYSLPRIAIRMSGKFTIAEIRGINENQNLEDVMLPILNEKLKEFGSEGSHYLKKSHDMYLLTEIDKKVKNNQDLTRSEIRFLYQLEDSIDGFGYEMDPRVYEILFERDYKKDLAFACDCLAEEVGISFEDLDKPLKVYFGNVKSNNDDFVMPEIIYGNLDLDELDSLGKLSLPNRVYGNLCLGSLKELNNIKLPKFVNGTVFFTNLIEMRGADFFEQINGNLYLDSLKYCENIIFPLISGSLDLSSLTDYKNIKLPNKVGGNLYLDKLKDASFLELPLEIGGSLMLCSLEDASNLKLPDSVGGNLNLDGLSKIDKLVLPKVVYNVYINNLMEADYLVFSSELFGSVGLKKLEKVLYMKLPSVVGNNLYLNSLTEIDNVFLPLEIGGSLYLNSLEVLNDVVLSEVVGGNVHLGSLKYVSSLKLPLEVGGNLYLNNLSSLNGIVLPKKVGGHIYLDGLNSLDGLVLPNDFDINRLHIKDCLRNELINNYTVSRRYTKKLF